MPRGRPSKFGRTDGIRTVSFRVNEAERQQLEADAAGEGLTVGALARKRALGREPVPSTETLQRELTVEYDE